MGFGLNLNAGGDYLPVLKYDARAGRLFRMDRDEVTGEQNPVDITEAFEAAVDFAHGEAGWCWFQAGQAPDFVMVPIGEALPPQPTKNHKQGVRLRLLLSSKAAGGKERLRELATTARSALAGLSALHDSWTPPKTSWRAPRDHDSVELIANGGVGCGVRPGSSISRSV